MTISSPHNQKLKEIRKLRQRRRWRERSHRFVAEGEDLLEAADAAGWRAVERFCASGSGLAGIEVEAHVLASASGLGSGTRTLAVYEERWAPHALGPLCLYLHGVQDPGNVGAVLRSAQAFGASAVAHGPGTADPFSPKAVRASMGAIFSVPVARAGELGALPGAKIALVAHRGRPLPELWRSGLPYVAQNAKVAEGSTHGEGVAPRDTPPPEATLMIGGERDGLPEALVNQADEVLHIPIRANSLNAAMAATVALYELQTRMAGAR